MSTCRRFDPLIIIIYGLIFCCWTVQGQNTDPLRFKACFEQLSTPWHEQKSNAGTDHLMPLDMVVYRSIEPGQIQQVVYAVKGQFYKSHRQSKGYWSSAKIIETELGDVVATHWSSLRDDQVKPFRPYPKNKETAVNASLSQNQEITKTLEEAVSERTQTEAPEDLAYRYVLFYRNICVERQFNCKDLDDSWAGKNAAYTFNQTLKLTKMHQIMDEVFLYQPQSNGQF